MPRFSRRWAPRSLAASVWPLAALLVLSLSAWPGGAAGQEGRKVALLVGVNKYHHAKLDPLSYAQRDVEELAKILRDQGYQVELLTGADARLANVHDRLTKLCQGLGRADQLLVAFAGHGLQPHGFPIAFYCPFDANPTINASFREGEPHTPDQPATLLAINVPERLVAKYGKGLLQRLDESGAGQKLVLVDACRNDSTARGRGQIINSAEIPDNTWLLLSCYRGERAWETPKAGGGHGVFFHHVLEGLRGQAANSEGVVTWPRLAEHVLTSVPRDVPKWIPDGAQQNPHEMKNGIGAPVLVRPRGKFKPGEVVTNSIGAKLVYVPAGVLPALEERKAKVTISQGLLVGVFEATQGEFEAVLKRNPSYFSPTGDGKDSISSLTAAEQRRLPVETVTWFDCVEFCNELSKKEGLKPYYTLASAERNADQSVKSATVTIAGGNGYRLLTEAEWEYCCRAGTTTAYHFGDVNNGREANINGNYPDGTETKGPYLQRTTPVGGYPANKFGLHDMHGNVRELCWDGYASYPDADTTDYSGPSGGTSRVSRGGSWLSYAWAARFANRLSYAPGYRDDDGGFRFARTP